MPGISPKIRPYLALALGVSALSMTGIFIRWAQAPGAVTAFYRMTIAAIVMLPLFLRQITRSPLRSWSALGIAVLGGLFIAFDHGLLSTAVNYTRIANASLMNNLAPVWVALASFVFWRERLPGHFWLGLALTMGGAVVVTGTDFILHPQLNLGNALGIASSLFYGGYFMITERARSRLRTLVYIWVANLTAAVALLGFNLAVHNPLSGFTTPTWLAFLGAGLLSQTVGYFAVGYALGHLPASIVSPTMVSQPVITALLAIPLAGEMLGLPQWLGALAVVAGIYLINQRRSTGLGAADALQTPENPV